MSERIKNIMVNSVVIAFLADILASIMCQIGLLIQKISHQHVEKMEASKQRPGKRLEEEGLSRKENSGAQDEGHSGGAYCSWRFWLGFAILLAGLFTLVCALPFLDLILFSVIASLSIIFSVALSIFVLGEQFIAKYDLSGLTFIALGCTCNILCAEKEEQKFTGEQAFQIIVSPISIVFLCFTIAFCIMNHFMLKSFVKNLRQFEADMDKIERKKTELNMNMQCLKGSDENSGPPELYQSAIFHSILPSRNLMQFESPNAKSSLIDTASEFVERPARILIEVIHSMPFEQLVGVSANSTQLKRWVKAPMILLIIGAGMASTYAVLLIKLGGELVQTESLAEHYIGLPIGIFLCISCGAC